MQENEAANGFCKVLNHRSKEETRGPVCPLLAEDITEDRSPKRGHRRCMSAPNAEAMCSSQLQAAEGNRVGPLATKMHQPTPPFCSGEFSPAVNPALCLRMWDCPSPGLHQPTEPNMITWAVVLNVDKAKLGQASVRQLVQFDFK
ncbi:hypothetical protein llap_2037 [Limosa lapponica baueri]|uniref:Uncharacterized protein n=1 Tax=Limosa lapponica baueri TaxID=1758121 RepID=A0A2I0UNL7_LIMLA|nr:hypothetical protein llap_2037 [Limosa lapponica baueri]